MQMKTDYIPQAAESYELDAASPKAVPEKRCYTVEDLQAILSVSRSTVYKLLATKEFRSFKVATLTRIDKQSFDEWLARLE